MPHPFLLRLSDITPQPVDWLWPDRLAAGTLVLLDGDPQEGKSLLTLDFAARLSTGRPLPDSAALPDPCSVVLLACEDNVRQAIPLRLRAAGADLDRIHLFRPRSPDGRDRLPSLPEDIPLLRAAVEESAARLVVVDPFLAFLSPRCCTLNDQLIRQALTPLAELAEQTKAVVLLIRHLTKSVRHRLGLMRGTGAIAIMGAARTGFLVGRHPDDPEVHLFACSKNNLAPMPTTLAYRIRPDASGHPIIDWQGPVTETAEELVRRPSLAVEPGEALRDAVALLRDILGHGPASCATVLRQAHAVGIMQRTLERAKAELKVRSEQRWIDNENIWFWSLPDNDDSERILRELYREDEEIRRNEAQQRGGAP
jgi:hypothetical protein